MILGLHIPTLISTVDASFKLCIKDLHIALQSAYKKLYILYTLYSKSDKDLFGVNRLPSGGNFHIFCMLCLHMKYDDV